MSADIHPVSMMWVSQERASNSARIYVYKQNFNSLSVGRTLPFPGATSQDGWFIALTPYPAHGEIQTNIAQVRKTLNEFTSSSVEGPVQKIDARLIKPPDLSRYPRITLQANFYADIRDLNATIIYTATIGMRGGAKSWL